MTARIAHFSVARRILETNDHVLTMGRGYAQTLIEGTTLRIVRAPLEIPPLRFSQIWRRQYDEDAIHRWLREASARVCTAKGEI